MTKDEFYGVVRTVEELTKQVARVACALEYASGRISQAAPCASCGCRMFAEKDLCPACGEAR